MKLIFIYGLPGVGKYTVAKALAEKTGLSLFHNHMVLNLITDIFGYDIPSVAALRENIWLDFFKQAGKRNFDGLIFTFCFDKYLQQDFLERVEAIIEPYGKVWYVALTCTDDVLKERVQRPSREKLHKIRDVASLMSQVADKSFYVPTLDREVLTIDNSTLSPEEVADRIVERYHIAHK